MSSKYLVSSILIAGVGLASAANARAASLGSPAMYAHAGRYNLTQGHSNGPICENQAAMMPSDRQTQCGIPQVTKTATGRYTITVANGAPLPFNSNDRGYAVWVQAVDSSAHCFEDSTTWTGFPNYTLTSKVRCVAPSSDPNTNTDVDSDYAWSYRTDSWGWEMLPSTPNHGYARVIGTNGALDTLGTYLPMMNFEVTSSRTQTGRYTVVFHDFNPVDALPVEGFLNNIMVQKTCASDTSVSCRRSVCIPYSWTSGSDTGIWDTTVNVRCYGADGNARDTDFRVFAGDEAHNSNYVTFPENRGGRYVWLNYPNTVTVNGCIHPTPFPLRAQHETPNYNFPTTPIQFCRSGLGRYTIHLGTNDFPLEIFPYHVDDISPVVSARSSGGGYCNPYSIVCNSTGCGAASESRSRLSVRCFDRAGSYQDAKFNLSLFY